MKAPLRVIFLIIPHFAPNARKTNCSLKCWGLHRTCHPERAQRVEGSSQLVMYQRKIGARIPRLHFISLGMTTSFKTFKLQFIVSAKEGDVVKHLLLYFSGTAEHTLCPEAAAAGGVGIADTVFFIVCKQFAVATVNAGGKLEIIELSAELFILCAVPNLRHTLLMDAAKSSAVNFAVSIVEPCVAIVEQCHTGTHLSVAADKGHAFPHKLTVRGLANDRLVIKV